MIRSWQMMTMLLIPFVLGALAMFLLNLVVAHKWEIAGDPDAQGQVPRETATHSENPSGQDMRDNARGTDPNRVYTAYTNSLTSSQSETPNPPNEWYAAYDIAARGVVGYWPLDADVSDYSGNNLHGTAYGTSVLAPGPLWAES